VYQLLSDLALSRDNAKLRPLGDCQVYVIYSCQMRNISKASNQKRVILSRVLTVSPTTNHVSNYSASFENESWSDSLLASLRALFYHVFQNYRLQIEYLEKSRYILRDVRN